MKEGTPIPENLRRLARGIEVFGAAEDMDLAAKRLLDRAEAEGHLQ